MPLRKVTAKGRITLRKELLQHLGVCPGDKIELDMLPNGRLEIRTARRVGHISDIVGMFKRPDSPSLTIEEIGHIAGDGWAGIPEHRDPEHG